MAGEAAASGGAGAAGGGGGLNLGAVIGGIGGLVGGILQARAQEKALRRFRRRQRAAIGEAREYADETVDRVTSGRLYSQAEEFLAGTFADSDQSPIVQDFRKAIQQAQASRGLFFGGASASQEAGGLALASQRLRQDLLPQIQQFALLPENLRQQTLAFEAPLRIAAATGAAYGGLSPQPGISVAGQGILSGTQGFIGGQIIGQELGAPQLTGGGGQQAQPANTYASAQLSQASATDRFIASQSNFNTMQANRQTYDLRPF